MEIESLYSFVAIPENQSISIKLTAVNWGSRSPIKDSAQFAISRQNIRTLARGKWLDSNIIEACWRIKLLKWGIINNRVLIPETITSTSLTGISASLSMTIEEHDCITHRMLAPLEDTEIQMWIMPINIVNTHWVSCTATYADSKIKVYDSLNGNFFTQASKLAVMLLELFTRGTNIPAHWKNVEWVVELASCPNQEPGDCGIHMLENTTDLLEHGNLQPRKTGNALRCYYLSEIKNRVQEELQNFCYIPDVPSATNRIDGTSNNNNTIHDHDSCELQDNSTTGELPNGLTEAILKAYIEDGRVYENKVWSAPRRTTSQIMGYIMKRDNLSNIAVSQLIKLYKQEPDQRPDINNVHTRLRESIDFLVTASSRGRQGGRK